MRFIHGAVRYPCTVVAGGDVLYVPDLYACVHVLDRAGRSLVVLGDDPQAWENRAGPTCRHPAGAPDISSPRMPCGPTAMEP